MSSKWVRRCLTAYCAAMAVAGAGGAWGADSSWMQWSTGNAATQLVVNRNNAVYDGGLLDTGRLRIEPNGWYITLNHGVTNIVGENVNNSVDIDAKVGIVFGYMNVNTTSAAAENRNITAEITTLGGIEGIINTGANAGCGVVLDAQTGSGSGSANGAIDLKIAADEGKDAVKGKVNLLAANGIKCVLIGNVNLGGSGTSINADNSSGDVNIAVAGDVGGGVVINSFSTPVNGRADLSVTGSLGGYIQAYASDGAAVDVNGDVGGSITLDTTSGTAGAARIRVDGNVAQAMTVNTADTQNATVNVGGTVAGLTVNGSNDVMVGIGGSTGDITVSSSGATGTVNFTSSGDIAASLNLNTSIGTITAKTNGVTGGITANAGKNIDLAMTGAAGNDVTLNANTGIKAELASVSGELNAQNLGAGVISINVAGDVGGGVDAGQALLSGGNNISIAVGGNIGGDVHATASGAASLGIGGSVAGEVSVKSNYGGDVVTVLNGNVTGGISAVSVDGAGDVFLTYRGTANPGTVVLDGDNVVLTLGGRADDIEFKKGAGTPTSAKLVVDGAAETASILTNLTDTEFKRGSLNLTLPGSMNLQNTVVNGTSSVVNNTGNTLVFEALTVNNGTFTLDAAGSNKNYIVNGNNLTVNAAGVLNIGAGVTFNTDATQAGNGTITIGDGGLMTAAGFTNNGAIILRGNANPTVCNFMTAGANFTNSGTVNFGGNTRIETGAGVFQNNAGGRVTVHGVNCLLDSSSLTNDGVLTFSNGGDLQVTGSIVNNGTVAFNLSGYTPGAAVTILNSGNSFTNNGGKITVNGGADGEYKLIGTTSAMDAAIVDAVVSASGMLNTYTAELNAANTLLTVNAKTNSDKMLAAALADSPANAGIAEAILQMSINGDLPLSIQLAMNQLPDSGSVGRAVTELNGHTAATAAARSTMNAIGAFNNAISQVFAFDHTTRVLGSNTAGLERLMPRDSSPSQVYHRQSARASAGGVPAEAIDPAVYFPGYNSGFVKFFGGWGNEDSISGSAGYSMSTFGVMLGIDRLVAQELRLGALFGYSYNQSYLGRDMGNVADNTLRLGGYAAYNLDNFYFNTTLTAGIHLLDSERKLHFLGTAAAGERPAFDFNWYNEAGYTFEIPGGFMLTPSYGLSLTYLHDTEYRESGAGDASLRVDAYDAFSLCQNVKMKFGKAFLLREDIVLLPEIWAGWEHEYLSGSDMSMNFTAAPSTPWNAPVSDIAADRAVFGAGVNTIFSRRYEIDARYDMKLWDGGYYSHLSLELGLKF